MANFNFTFTYNRSLYSLFYIRHVWDLGIVFQIQQMRFEIGSYFCNYTDQSEIQPKAFSIDQFTVFCSNVLEPANTQTRFPNNAFILFEFFERNMRKRRHGFLKMHFFSVVLSEICEHKDTRMCCLKYANTQTRFLLNEYILFECFKRNMRKHRHGFPIMRLFSSTVLSEICEHTDTVSSQCLHFIGSWQRTVGRTRCSLQYEVG